MGINMSNLPTADEMVGNSVTEFQFKSKLKQLVESIDRTYESLDAANADIENIAPNTKVEILSQTEGGVYFKPDETSTLLVKHPNGPLDIAKHYADENKLDLTEISYSRENGNIVPDAVIVVNRGLDQNFVYQFDTAYESKIIPVVQDTILYLLNTVQEYRESAGFGLAFFDKDPSIHNDAMHIVDSRSESTDRISKKKYISTIVPTNAKFLVFNTKFINTRADWAIHLNKFSEDYAAGVAVKIGLESLPLIKNFTNKAIEQLNNGCVVGDLYDSADVIGQAYLNVNGELLLNGQSDWVVYHTHVEENAEYYLKIDAHVEPPFRVQLSSSLTTVDLETKLETVLVSTDFENIYKLLTPASTKSIFVQVKFGTALNILDSFSLQKDYFDFDLIQKLKRSLTNVDGLEVVDLEARKKLAMNNTNQFESPPNIFTEHELVNNWYVSLFDKSLQPFGGWKIAFIPVTAGDKLVITADKIESPFEMGFYADGSLTAGKVSISYVREVVENKINVTVPIGATYMAINVYIVGGNNNFDIQNSLYVSKEPEATEKEIYRINGKSLIDVNARDQIVELSKINAIDPMLRFKNKKVFALGDSITEGTQGGYVKYLNEAFGTSVLNYGSSGARTSRGVDIITAGAGLPRRDPVTAGWTWLVKDFTDLKCVTMMFGTNDLADMPMGSIDDLPTTNLTDYPNPLDYWALFPNTYIGNIALMIEFIKSKASSVEIHFISPPYAYNTTLGGPDMTASLIPHLEAVTQLYSVHLIYGTFESGLSYKLMKSNISFSYDGTHLNTLGNEVFGKFVANKVLSVG